MSTNDGNQWIKELSHSEWLNKPKLGDYIDRIFLIESEIKDIRNTAKKISYLDLHLQNDSESPL
jgi:uncharacterized protein (UPF0335 family)